MASDAAGAVHAAVAGGTLTDDSARAILRCIDADGFVDAPNDLLEGIAREVIEAAGVEFRLAKGPNLPATPGETDQTHSETEAPADADRSQKPVSPSSRGFQRPQKRRKRRKRTQPPSQPAPASAANLAAQETPSRPAKTPDERRIAWAWANRDEAAAIIRANASALAAYAAPDIFGPDAPPRIAGGVANPDAAVLDWSPHHTELSSRDLLRATENLGVLAHAVEHYGPNDRNDPILPSTAAGTPTVHVHNDRLPTLPAKPGPVQSALPFVPDQPEHVLPVYLLNTDRRLLEHGGNRAVPLPWRFWYEALLSAPFAAYGSEAVLAPRVADLIRFAGWNRFQRYRHLPELAAALATLDRMALPYRGTAWRPVLVRNIPASDQIDLNTEIEFSIKLPPGSRQGPQIDRRALRSLAPRSFPRYRGLLGLSAYWDRYGRGRGGADATADNPEVDRWPVLTSETLRLMLFPAGRDNPSTERSDRKRAVAHVKSMEAEGIVEMVPAGAGWRIYRRRP